MTPAIGNESIGTFRILDAVHGTSRATVSRGIDQRTGAAVAVKIGAAPRAFGGVTLADLAPALWGPGAVADPVEHEADALRAVAGEGVPALLGTGTHDGRPWIATAWHDGVRGDALALAGEGRYERIAAIAVSVAAVLERAAAAGVVHRDIKPDNLLVGPGGVVLVDWELAQVGERRPWGIVGARGFRDWQVHGLETRPERLASPAADLFSMGATLYWLATGHSPFPPVRSILPQLLGEAASLGIACPDAPPRLVEVVDALLRASLAERPTAADVVGALGGAPWEPPPRVAWGPEGLARVESALVAGDLDAASGVLNATPPGDARALLLAARLFEQAGADAEAMHALEGPIGNDDLQAALVAARVARRRGVDATALARDAGDGAEAWAERGLAEVAAGREELAVGCCVEAVARDVSAGSRSLAAVLDTLLARVWGDPTVARVCSIAEIATRLAVMRCGGGAYDEAGRALLRLTVAAAGVALRGADEPRSLPPRVATLLVAALAELGSDEALAVAPSVWAQGGFGVARRRIPIEAAQLERPLTVRLLALAEAGHAGRLLAVADEAPDDAAGALDRARAALLCGDGERARGALDRAARWGAPSGLLRAVQHLVTGNASAAMIAARPLGEAAPAGADGWWVLGRCLLRGGAAAEAARAAQEAVRIEPSPEHLVLLAEAALAAGRWDVAVSAAAAVPELTPDDRPLLLGLATRRDDASAAALVDAAARRDPVLAGILTQEDLWTQATGTSSS